MGQEMEFGAYVKNGKLAVSAPMLLGDEVYGIDFNTLETDLKNCELWAMMGTTYEEFLAQTGVDFDAIAEAVQNYIDSMANSGASLEDCLKDVEVSSEETTVTINGESVKAVNVKYHLTSDDVHAFLSAYLDMMEDSVDALKDTFADVLPGVDMDEIISVDMDRYEMDDMFEAMDLEGDLVISVNPDNQYIMSVSFDFAGTVDGDEGKVDMDLVLGVDPTNSDKFSLTMYFEDDEYRSGVTVDWDFASKGDVDTVTMTVNMDENGETSTIMTGKLTYDNGNGKYELSADADGQAFSIKGVYKLTDDKFEISLDTITNSYDGEEETEIINLRLCIETISKSEMPDMPNMKNVLKLTQDEWVELIGKFQTAEPDDSFDEDIYYDESIEFEDDYLFGEDAA
jgi:hypothetical protein